MNRVIVVLTLVAAAACSRGLSHEEAKRLIEGSPLIKAAEDHVTVDALSASSTNETIVRATIAGQTTNLKFRRYDKGWAWEFVETRSGGWIAPDRAIAEIRERSRLARANEWAAQNRDAYALTATDMRELITWLPGKEVTLASWMKARQAVADSFEALGRMREKNPGAFPPEGGTPEALAKWRHTIALLRNESAADAWGMQFLVSFDASNGEALIMSVGSDKKKGTEDDLVCLAKWRDKGRETSFDRKWSVPEGLGDILESNSHPEDRVEFTTVVKN